MIEWTHLELSPLVVEAFVMMGAGLLMSIVHPGLWNLREMSIASHRWWFEGLLEVEGWLESRSGRKAHRGRYGRPLYLRDSDDSRQCDCG